MDSGATSQASFDAAEARYQRVQAGIAIAEAAVQAARVALENTVIRAPFDGTVLTKNADVGEVVAPLAASAFSKSAVITLADLRSLQVEADVAESRPKLSQIAPPLPQKRPIEESQVPVSLKGDSKTECRCPLLVGGSGNSWPTSR